MQLHIHGFDLSAIFRNATFRSHYAMLLSRLLESEFDAAKEGFAAWGLAGGCCEFRCNVTAGGEADGVGGVGRHAVICVAVANLGF